MSLQYLLTEYEKYDDCKGPLILNDGQKYWLPPPEVTEACLEEVLGECIQIVLMIASGSKIDDQGVFQHVKRQASASGKGIVIYKNRVPHVPTIPQVLERMVELGYNIPRNYWHQIRGKIRKKWKG